MYYPCSENKGADQLRGYREADLRLCFRICRLLVFPCHVIKIVMTSHVLTLFFQFNIPLKFISAHMRRANQKVGRKPENPAKNKPASRTWLVSHVARASATGAAYCGNT